LRPASASRLNRRFRADRLTRFFPAVPVLPAAPVSSAAPAFSEVGFAGGSFFPSQAGSITVNAAMQKTATAARALFMILRRNLIFPISICLLRVPINILYIVYFLASTAMLMN
jgi:hypothetical protein